MLRVSGYIERICVPDLQAGDAMHRVSTWKDCSYYGSSRDAVF